MKFGKKLLAVALAGVLALSVLTGCSGNSSKIDGDKLVKAISIFEEDYSYSAKYDSSLNKTAQNAMNAVKAKVDGKTITMENAIGRNGTLLKKEKNKTVFTTEGAGLEAALELSTTNKDKYVCISLVNAKGIKDELYLLVATIENGLFMVQSERYDYCRMGFYESGDYLFVVLIGETNA